MIQIKNSDQIALMREAGRITAEALLVARENVKEGISTKELDTIIRNHIERSGAKPSFLGYAGFPGSACISINDEVIHGIPSKTRITAIWTDMYATIDSMNHLSNTHSVKCQYFKERRKEIW